MNLFKDFFLFNRINTITSLRLVLFCKRLIGSKNIQSRFKLHPDLSNDHDLPSPFDSIRDAVFTVSPNKQYRGILSPTTPATHGPEEQQRDLKYSRCYHQGRNRHIFLRGQSNFSWFFSRCEMFFFFFFFFSGKNSHFGRPETNFRRFQKWKEKKEEEEEKKKLGGSSPIFYNFTIFPSLLLNFYPFGLFSLPLFPDTSAKNSRSEVSGGTLPPAPCPPPVTPLAIIHHKMFISLFGSHAMLNLNIWVQSL